MIVTDASVIYKWFSHNEPYRELSLALYQNHAKGKQKIIIPRLLYLEIANALTTKSHTSTQDIKKSLSLLYKADLIEYQITREDVIESSILAKKYATSVYDMLYAVIAKKRKTNLITADQKFVEKTKFKFIKLLKDIETS